MHLGGTDKWLVGNSHTRNFENLERDVKNSGGFCPLRHKDHWIQKTRCCPNWKANEIPDSVGSFWVRWWTSFFVDTFVEKASDMHQRAKAKWFQKGKPWKHKMFEEEEMRNARSMIGWCPTQNHPGDRVRTHWRTNDKSKDGELLKNPKSSEPAWGIIKEISGRDTFNFEFDDGFFQSKLPMSWIQENHSKSPRISIAIPDCGCDTWRRVR